jgi:hypothetical protein
MIISKLFGSMNPKQIIALVIAALILTAALSLGSYALPEKSLTTRRGIVAIIPRPAREGFVVYRPLVGPAAVGGAILVATGWAAAEGLARAWQKRRNEELAANAVLLRLSPRVDELSKWEAAADLWRAVHSTLARSGRETWLGSGWHLSLELVQPAGERLAFYLWVPRPVAETLLRQFRATYAGLEIEAMVNTGEDGGPIDEIDDYLDSTGQLQIPHPESLAWQWADLGLAGESWRPLRTEFSGDPLASLLSALEGLNPGNVLAAVQFVLRPAAEGWQQGSQVFARKARGDEVKPGKPKPRLGHQERDQIKRIE